MGGVSEGRMTLVVALSVVGRLVRPDEALADARGWSEHVGVVGDASSDEMMRALEQRGIDQDFVSGQPGIGGSLAAIRQRFPTERHVFIGTSDEDGEIAEALGWEYLSIEDAAEQADWELVDAGSPSE